jgi:hypothetical protein
MGKPFDLAVLHQRIVEICGDKAASSAKYGGGDAASEKGGDSLFGREITSIFLVIGIPAHIQGIPFPKEAIRVVMEERRYNKTA